MTAHLCDQGMTESPLRLQQHGCCRRERRVRVTFVLWILSSADHSGRFERALSPSKRLCQNGKLCLPTLTSANVFMDLVCVKPGRPCHHLALPLTLLCALRGALRGDMTEFQANWMLLAHIHFSSSAVRSTRTPLGSNAFRCPSPCGGSCEQYIPADCNELIGGLKNGEVDSDLVVSKRLLHERSEHHDRDVVV